MSFITALINFIMFAGTSTPNRLHKKPTCEDHIRNLNCWVERNFYIIALAAIVFLLVAFVIVCFMVVGVSAVESGTYYNHFSEVV